MTGPLRIQVNYCNNGSCFIALREYDAYILSIVCYTFQCIAGTTRIVYITFVVVYFSILHYFFHFCLCNMAAIHSAFCMIAVLQVRNSPVETAVTVYFCRGITLVCIGFRVRLWFVAAFTFSYCNRYHHQCKQQQVRQCLADGCIHCASIRL